MTAEQLDRMMTKLWGADWRAKTIIGPLGSWRLGEAFEECGLRDPQQRVNPSSGYPGVYQFVPASGRLYAVPQDRVAQALAAARYIEARAPVWRGERVAVSGLAEFERLFGQRPRIFDELARWMRPPWWAQVIAWAIAAYYVVKGRVDG